MEKPNKLKIFILFTILVLLAGSSIVCLNIPKYVGIGAISTIVTMAILIPICAELSIEFDKGTDSTQ